VFVFVCVCVVCDKEITSVLSLCSSVHVNYQNSRFSMIINEAPLHDVKALMWCATVGAAIVEPIIL